PIRASDGLWLGGRSAVFTLRREGRIHDRGPILPYRHPEGLSGRGGGDDLDEVPALREVDRHGSRGRGLQDGLPEEAPGAVVDPDPGAPAVLHLTGTPAKIPRIEDDVEVPRSRGLGISGAEIRVRAPRVDGLLSPQRGDAGGARQDQDEEGGLSSNHENLLACETGKCALSPTFLSRRYRAMLQGPMGMFASPFEIFET